MRRLSIVILAVVLLGFAAMQGFAADTWYITTVAGTGTKGYSGDGGPATKAMLGSMGDIYVTSTGALFIADMTYDRIRKVDESGVVTTVAGNGVRGFSGDGGPATAASLNDPRAVDFDQAGNMYIADYGNRRIRKVDTSGIITTIAGTGKTAYTGDGGPAIEADLTGTLDVHVDHDGNVYLAEGLSGTHVIRRIDRKGVITTFAGTGARGDTGDGGPAIEATLNVPCDLYFDQQGNLFISEGFGNRIRKVDIAGVIWTVAGPKPDGGGVSKDGVLATKEWLFGPQGVCIDARGDILIADTELHRIRMVDTAGIIWTIAGTLGRSGYSGDGGPALSAKLHYPFTPRVGADGSIYFIDEYNFVVRKLYRP